MYNDDYHPAHSPRADDSAVEIAARIRQGLQIIQLRQACGITYASRMSDDDARASLRGMSLDNVEVMS